MDIVPDDVVISGVGGYFPKAVNIEEFKQRLFENNYLLEQKWPEDKNMCTKVGPIDSDYFDNSYFGIHRQQCFFMDPMHRLALERTFEALIDAGVNPNELRGKRIGVFMGSTIGENDQLFMESVVSGFGVTGHSRAMLANRISYWLNLKGPSVAYDANWVSGVEVLRLAYYAVKTGQCDSVIIGTTNLAQHVQFQFMYNDMGILSQDGSTKAYDANATGYGRAEGVVVMYIQRSSEARRLYASVESIATKFDGTTPGDFLDIPTESMVDFLEEFYKKSKVKPEEIEFVEAYGCGNKVIDKNEIDALEKVLCKSRSKPLLVGSVKTVTGHAEASAAMLSLVKAIVALETETIPATLQHETPNPEIKAFRNGTVEVVTDNRKWDPKYVAVNCLSTSAYFGHVVMKANPKKKVPISIDLPTLLIASTRTEEGMTNILERMKSKPKDAEYYKLVHEVFSKSIQGHLYRGYLLLGEEETKQETINHMGNKRPIWFVYSGMGSQWNGMLGDLMKIEVFANSIYKCRDILAKKGVDLMNILSSSDKNIFDNILNCFVGIAAMQIALTDVLRALGIVPDGIIGHSVGELGCAYADGCMTAEQMIMSSYSRGRASIEATLIKGMMAATGLGYNQIKNRVPPTIEVACHNGPDSCTISGPTEDMEQFVKTLQNQGVFAKLVNVANIAYHSRYIKPAAPLLLKYLKEVLPKPMLRSSKWVSTSNLEANWDTDLAKHSSAEYHTNNLLSSVLFEEGIKHIPKDSVLIEIAPHGLLQAILKRSVKECTSIPLTQRGAKSSVEFLMQSLGKIYLSGVDLKLANIYPKIEYPVSRNTPSLGDLVEWNHSESWSRIEETQESIVGVRNIDINLSSEEFHYCNAHKLHGQVVLPVSTYLNIILQITENAFGGLAVIIENMHLKKQLVVPVVGFIPINAMVQHGSGEFEIFSGEELLVTGKITVVEQEDEMEPLEDLEIPVTKESVHLLENDIYNELEDRGCQYEERFRRIKNMFLSQNGASAHVSWNNWEELIESMIQQQLFQSGERDQRVYVPRYIQKITICHKLLPTSPETKVNFDYSTRTLYAPGIEIHDMKTTIFRKTTLDVQLNSEDIVPLDNVVNDIESGIEQAVQLTLSNLKEQSVNKIFISELETAVPLENNIKNVMSNYSYHVNQSLVKEIKQIVMSESYPQLLVMNDFVNSDLMKLLHNSENAFLLAKVDPDRSLDQNVAIVARFRCGPDHYIICRKVMNTKPRIINITEKTISLKDLDKKSAPWVSELLKNPQDSTPTLLVTSSVPVEGFSNFIDRIRSLPNLRNVRIFYNLDQNSAKVEEAFKKNLSLTLLKDNHWYTYLPLTLKKKEKSDKKSSPTPIIENKLIRYIGLNLKDETLAPALRNNNEIGNIDYCGVTKNGQRVMGLAQLDKESSKLVVDDILTWEVPDDFSLEDAITIPHAYACAYYMIVVKGRIKHGETVLIHKGCSPIGLAAISIAYSYGCQIFTTVTTQRQNVYLRKVYSYLAERNVLDANSSNFETDVMFATGGKGVELLLNCVSGVLLKSSVACMGFYGRFIQYGQYDLEQGNCIGMSIFLKNVDFYHVDLQNIFRQDKETKQQIRQLITDGFKNFVVRPLRKEILSHQNIASVIKKLESPETIGKIAIDAVNNLSINKLNIKEPNRFICNSRSSYLVFGGSTSSWIQLIEWLVHRGARKIVVSTDKKPAENHLNRRLAILENYYGADIIMASSKIQSRNNADQLVSEVTNLGPLHAMFVLPVGSVGEETVELFDGSLKSLAPKALLVNFLKAATGICYQRAIAGFLTNNIQVQNEEEMKDIISSLDVILDSNVSNVLAKKFISIDAASDESKATIDDFTKLIPNLDDIIRLQKNAPEKPELVQVLTEGPSEIRELLPVFIIPGLTGFKELETFVRNLLYPTFCAVLPSTSWPLEKLAEVYAQKMSEIVPKPVYNIVSISSGGPLAIQIARILAKKNVSLHLYLIDSAPQRLQQGLHNLGDDNVQVEISMLRTVFELNDLELIKQLRGCPNFEARIKLLLKMVDRSDKHKVLLEKGLKLAKEFIEKIKAFKPNDELLSGRVHLLVPEDCNIYDTYGLTSYFKNLHAVEQISGNHLSIIQHKDTHEYVNKNHYQI